MKILLTGGGTGGHIFPLISVVREVLRLYPNNQKIKFFYLGPPNGLHSILLSHEGIRVNWVLSGKIRRYINPLSILQNILDIFIKIPIGFIQAFLHIFFIAPDVIFSKGGYGSFAVVICGWFLRIPIFLHESDITPGIANKILSHFARKVFVSFPDTEYFPYEKMILVGNPIRKELLSGAKGKAIEAFKITKEKPIIFVMGGSQGAEKINDVILEILPEMLQNFEILHQFGEKNFEQMKAEAKVMMTEDYKKYYHQFAFLQEPELKLAYAVADIIVSRAGSGSIFEIAALGKPSVLIPLPESAQDHQTKNAYSFANAGAAIVFEEENLIPHFLLEKLKYIATHPIENEKMSANAKAFYRPEAAKDIAQAIIGAYNE